ncbi:rhomboid family intramembrane serine protease [Aestuariibius sp. 2305UL40-4]|uniref:rhomboid family intramembrane serine protease n=1 Tax=Aestuariibius violaceus TaxID=3234132 RepID=UPI00345E43F3
MQGPKAVNPLPPSVLALFAVMALVEVVLSLGGSVGIGGAQAIGWRNEALSEFALPPRMLSAMAQTGDYQLDYLRRFVTYPFVHGGFLHAAFACVILLALGKFVGEVFSSAAVIVVFFTSGILAALIYSGLAWSNYPLFGAYPAVYGLIGAYTYILWVGIAATGGRQIEAFRLILILAGLHIAFSVFGVSPHIIADFAGFAVGFAVAPLAAPGGVKALMTRIKRR